MMRPTISKINRLSSFGRKRNNHQRLFVISDLSQRHRHHHHAPAAAAAFTDDIRKCCSKSSKIQVSTTATAATITTTSPKTVSMINSMINPLGATTFPRPTSVSPLFSTRWMSSTKSTSERNNDTNLDSPIAATNSKDGAPTKAGDPNLANPSNPPPLSSASSTAAEPAAAATTSTTLTTNNTTFTTADMNDQLIVAAIAVLTGLIVLAPRMMQRVKEERGDGDFFYSTDDPIDDLTRELYKLVEEEALDEGLINAKNTDAGPNEDGSSPSTNKRNNTRQNVVESMLRDVFQSQALQEAAQQFVVSTLQSEVVRQAFQRLLKELALDLLQDPETMAQVVKLLQFAIQNPQVRHAAQDLVIDIVNDPNVKEAVVAMIQRLGRDAAIQQATETLLSESAHAVLNDDEILDHSMEFATDVLGDDIVQQTAGEALRNTVGHAVRPAAATAVWVAAGVSWIAVAFIALGYANNDSSTGRLLHRASDLASRALGSCLWPVELLGKVLWMPIDLAGSIASGAANWLASLPGKAFHSLNTGISALGQSLSQSASSFVIAATLTAWEILQSTWAYCASLIVQSATSVHNAASQAAAQMVTLAQKKCEKQTSYLYESLVFWLTQTTNNINALLTEWAFWIENIIANNVVVISRHNSSTTSKTNGHA